MFHRKCKMAILLIACMTIVGAGFGLANPGQARAERPREPPPPAEKAAASVSDETEKSRPERGLYEVSLKDGRQLSLRLLTEEIEITTLYGKLKVPVADIRCKEPPASELIQDTEVICRPGSRRCARPPTTATELADCVFPLVLPCSASASSAPVIPLPLFAPISLYWDCDYRGHATRRLLDDLQS